MHHYYVKIFCFVIFMRVFLGHPNNLAWYGGPVHWECEHGAELFTHTGQYVKENVIAMKAVAFQDEIYVMTPRLKRGILATVWRLVKGRSSVELQPYPELRDHAYADCRAIQNAIDIYLDQLGNLWVLDSGIVETIESPRCTCPPKVVEISMLLKKIIRHVAMSSLASSSSLLQNLVIEHVIGPKPYIYVSDASRGAVLVHEVSTDAQWSVLTGAPAARLQLALVQRNPTHSLLLLVRIPHAGILELDTAALRRQNSLAPLRVFAEQAKPVVLLGAESHYVYLRLADCSDVLRWDTKEAYNSSNFINLHSPGPHLTPHSVSENPFKHTLLILDSNYKDTIYTGSTYHRITFIGQL